MDFKDWKRNETWADNKIQDTQQPDKYETDSDNESDEKKLARKLAMRFDNLTGGW